MTWVRASCHIRGSGDGTGRLIEDHSGWERWLDRPGTTSPPMEMAVTGAIGVPNVAWSDVEP